MTEQRDLLEIARLLERAANMFSLPAHPMAWPEWMTEAKRHEMTVNFRGYAAELKRHVAAHGERVDSKEEKS